MRKPKLGRPVSVSGKTITINLDAKSLKALDRLATKSHQSKSAVIRELLKGNFYDLLKDNL